MSEAFEIKLKPIRKMWYNEEYSNGGYSCITEEKGKVKLSKWDNFLIKGTLPSLILNLEYTAILVEKEDKRGLYYEPQSIFEDIPSDPNKQRIYLSQIIAPSHVNALYNAYPNQNIIGLIQNNQLDITKVKGVGKKSLNKIKEKIEQNVEYREAFEFLGQYQINPKLIIKLVKHFKSSKLTVQKVKESPYNLLAIKGIGFIKADEVAMKMKFPKDSEKRILAAIEYIIEENEKDGHTYMNQSDLLDKAHELLDVNTKLIRNQLIDTEAIGIYGNCVALKRTYEAEKFVSNKLKEILQQSSKLNFNVEKFIQDQEKKKGITLTDQQKSFFYNIRDYNVNILCGFAGCVDNKTEFFNGHEWKYISDYQEGDLVLQYIEDGTATLVNPLAYHKLPETKMTLIKTELGSINQCLSNEHTVVYRTSKGHIAKLPFHEVARRHREIPKGFYGKFITHFKYDSEGIGLSDAQIRVMVMVIADGHFKNSTSLCNVRVKKDRKKIRIRKILSEANIPFKEKECVDSYSVFTFNSPLRLKHFDSIWYHCSQIQLQVICDEVLHWDGSIDKKGRERFSSNVKESADFIQFAFSATGRRATLYERDRTGQTYKDSNYIRKSKEYGVHIAKNKWVSLFARHEEDKTPLIEVTPEDGYKYCFSVPSEMWVMRREGRICVTGNCGKSQIQSLLVDLLDQLGISYLLLSPTGKAAKVLSGFTGREAMTVHRAILQNENVKYEEGDEEEEDKESGIQEQFVIVDEASMLDIKLASALLNQINRTDARILFVGDAFQIPSVNSGLFLHDSIESKVIPTTTLDIVFRQKEGGILSIATQIRTKEKFLKNTDTGIIPFGNNCVVAAIPQEKMEAGYNYYYNQLLEQYAPEDIMVLSPTKKGKLGTIAINENIQKIINPSSDGKLEITYGKEPVTIFRENDYILNIKNTYRALDIDEQEVDIMNGDSGVLERIDMDEEEVVVNFDDTLVPISFGNIKQLIHSWCITMHKSQGSGSKAVIVILDKAHKFMGNANLLYTGVTRSKDFLVILTQAETLNFVMKKNANMQRNTFLQNMLESDI